MENNNITPLNGNDPFMSMNSDEKNVDEGPEFYETLCWRSPSNIALIKYWGKKIGQIPENPSVSMTLSKSFTETTLRYSTSGKNKGGLKRFCFEGKENESFVARVKSYLKEINSLFPFINDYDLMVDSTNSFPHSSGIASSASALSALALCLTSMESRLYNLPTGDENFLRKASFAARIGSGSAARSVYPGYVLWGEAAGIPNSANEFAIPVNEMIHDSFRKMKDTILLVDESPKAVSSSSGHVLMQTNPWSAIRYEQARNNTSRLMDILSSGDLDEFIRIVETEALTLHALIMSSSDGYLLLKPGTIDIIDKIRKFRRAADVPVAFTLDAGPNVHIIYPDNYHEQVIGFVKEELLQHCKKGNWIDDGTGTGPEEVKIKT